MKLSFQYVASLIIPKNVIMRGESVVEDGELIDDHVGEHVKELEAVDH